MSRWNTLKKILTDKDYRTIRLAKVGFYNHLDDRAYIEKIYRAKMGKPLNLENPQLFNEKLQWLKLYDRNPLYTQLVDKYRVREYIAEKIGEEYLIPLLGVWDDPDEIDFDALPDQFVLKCNHNSGTGMCICRDKSKLDYDKVRKELRKALKENFFYRHREWPYKNVHPKIVCEKYLAEIAQSEAPLDYKFACFNGKMRYVEVHVGRFLDYFANFYDENGNILPYGEAAHPPRFDSVVTLPKSFDRMIEIAEKLAGEIAFLRVDLYCVNEKIYFGELTFYDAAGLDESTSAEWDAIRGNWIDLSNRK